MRLVRKRAPIYAGLTLYAILAGLPIYWMIITTFKPDPDLYNLANNPLWFNQPPTLANIQYLFQQTRFMTWMLNSLTIGVAVVAITLLVAVPAGYALARLRLSRRRRRRSWTIRRRSRRRPGCGRRR